MLDEDPKVKIWQLIDNEWWEPETDYAGTPDVHTGWYDNNSGTPQITVTNNEEFVIGGGNTGHTAISHENNLSQLRRGEMLVNCWSGTREDLRGASDTNSDINPKKLSYQMASHSFDILADHGSGRINGEQFFNSLAPGPVREVPETEEEFISRHEITVIYTYKQ